MLLPLMCSCKHSSSSCLKEMLDRDIFLLKLLLSLPPRVGEDWTELLVFPLFATVCKKAVICELDREWWMWFDACEWPALENIEPNLDGDFDGDFWGDLEGYLKLPLAEFVIIDVTDFVGEWLPLVKLISFDNRFKFVETSSCFKMLSMKSAVSLLSVSPPSSRRKRMSSSLTVSSLLCPRKSSKSNLGFCAGKLKSTSGCKRSFGWNKSPGRSLGLDSLRILSLSRSLSLWVCQSWKLTFFNNFEVSAFVSRGLLQSGACGMSSKSFSCNKSRPSSVTELVGGELWSSLMPEFHL